MRALLILVRLMAQQHRLRGAAPRGGAAPPAPLPTGRIPRSPLAAQVAAAYAHIASPSRADDLSRCLEQA